MIDTSLQYFNLIASISVFILLIMASLHALAYLQQSKQGNQDEQQLSSLQQKDRKILLLLGISCILGAVLIIKTNLWPTNLAYDPAESVFPFMLLNYIAWLLVRLELNPNPIYMIWWHIIGFALFIAIIIVIKIWQFLY